MNHVRRFSFVLMFVSGLLATGCGEIGKPMEDSEFIALVVDLHVLEARRELVADTHPALRDSILAAHGISPAQFRAAVGYYAERPDEYTSIYNRIIDSLSAEEAELEEEGVLEVLPPP